MSARILRAIRWNVGVTALALACVLPFALCWVILLVFG